MAGPRPAGAPWTPEDDRKLIEMVAAKTEKVVIAYKLKRTDCAVKVRLTKLRKLVRRCDEVGN